MTNMNNKFSQYQKILQRMALTPKMKHSIQMLSMSIGDLNEYIDTMISSNPFLQKIIDNKYKFDRKMTAIGSTALEYNDAMESEKAWSRTSFSCRRYGRLI